MPGARAVPPPAARPAVRGVADPHRDGKIDAIRKSREHRRGSVRRQESGNPPAPARHGAASHRGAEARYRVETSRPGTVVDTSKRAPRPVNRASRTDTRVPSLVGVTV